MTADGIGDSGGRDARPPSADARETLDDRALVQAMRRGDDAAFREYVRRFRPLLRDAARRLGASTDRREECVEEVLGDAAVQLASPRARVPRSLAAYLVSALRHRFLNGERDRGRRELRARSACSRNADDTGGAVESTCAEATLSASRGPAWEPPAVAPELARLAATLTEGLAEEERLLLVWVSHEVPHRQIALWLGVSHAAAQKRVERLRARLRSLALRHVETVPESERRALARFFRRADAEPARTGGARGARHEGVPTPHDARQWAGRSRAYEQP